MTDPREILKRSTNGRILELVIRAIVNTATLWALFFVLAAKSPEMPGWVIAAIVAVILGNLWSIWNAGRAVAAAMEASKDGEGCG